jgi:hypothetical protein
VDIAVVGAGSAGIAAAVAAARAGRQALLMDVRPAAGGTGGHSGLTTLCGLFDDTGAFLNEGFAREFADALAETPPLRMGRVFVLPYRPAKFRGLAAQLLQETPRLQTRWNTPLGEVVTDGDRIVRLNGFDVRAVIDCTGNAGVARAVNADCLATDEATQAPAVIFQLQNVERDLSDTPAVARVLLPIARAGFPPLSFQPDLEPRAVTVKFSGPLAQARDLVDFLRSNITGFDKCQISAAAFTSAQRSGRMIVGRHILTGPDVLAARKFPDAVARCAWPIEQWGVDGVARFRYLPEGAFYEVPAGSLRAAGIQNLFMAGKTISADTDAIASARVMGCCLATGAAAGNLAAISLESSGKT